MFNPNEHMIPLKGRDYLQVAWRLVWFREDHPDWCIDATVLEMDGEHAIFKASIYDETGILKCSGHGSESKRDFGDFIEKAETKAVGRALAMLGYGTQFTATEFDEGERIVDTPIDRAPRGTKEAAQEVGQKKLAEIERSMSDLATDEQKRIIKEKADDDTYLKAMQHFGSDLERLTAGQAVKLIARIT